MHHIQHIRADILQDLKNQLPGATKEMIKALDFHMNPETLMLASVLMLKTGNPIEARNFLKSKIKQMPPGVLKRRDDWRTEIAKLHQLICKTPGSNCNEQY